MSLPSSSLSSPSPSFTPASFSPSALSTSISPAPEPCSFFSSAPSASSSSSPPSPSFLTTYLRDHSTSPAPGASTPPWTGPMMAQTLLLATFSTKLSGRSWQSTSQKTKVWCWHILLCSSSWDTKSIMLQCLSTFVSGLTTRSPHTTIPCAPPQWKPKKSLPSAMTKDTVSEILAIIFLSSVVTFPVTTTNLGRFLLIVFTTLFI
mmetsp:Transcript_9653/g.19254  ORF Transcript_9653/g.19254 Transcript_9653/m.19254 type:complete len:205 (+) Transcript_9653:143-757(+)